MRAICLITTKYRAHQALALIFSLLGMSPKVQFFVLCMDIETFSALNSLRLEQCRLYKLQDVETPKLRQLRIERPLNAYCWTMKPVFLSLVLESYPSLDTVIYLDSDLYFFQPIESVVTLNTAWSILLSTHHVNRKCNGGFVAFRNDPSGRKCLSWWKDQCIEWCDTKVGKNGFGDQGYLDHFRFKCTNARFLNPKVTNVAFWNERLHPLTKKQDTFYIEDHPLIFYHFSGFHLVDHEQYFSQGKRADHKVIYQAYAEALRKSIDVIAAQTPAIVSNFYSASER